MLTKLPSGDWIDLSTIVNIQPYKTHGTTPAAAVTIERQGGGLSAVRFDSYEAATSFADGLAERVNAAKAAEAESKVSNKPAQYGSLVDEDGPAPVPKHLR